MHKNNKDLDILCIAEKNNSLYRCFHPILKLYLIHFTMKQDYAAIRFSDLALYDFSFLSTKTKCSEAYSFGIIFVD